jgi:hypothetical protein
MKQLTRTHELEAELVLDYRSFTYSDPGQRRSGGHRRTRCRATQASR